MRFDRQKSNVLGLHSAKFSLGSSYRNSAQNDSALAITQLNILAFRIPRFTHFPFPTNGLFANMKFSIYQRES